MKKIPTKFQGYKYNDFIKKVSENNEINFQYARLRAIEQRQPVVRSANTGISGVISSSGEIIQKTKWDEEIALRVDVPTNKGDITFYSIYGDYIGRIASFISILIILFSFVKGRIKKTSAINS